MTCLVLPNAQPHLTWSLKMRERTPQGHKGCSDHMDTSWAPPGKRTLSEWQSGSSSAGLCQFMGSVTFGGLLNLSVSQFMHTYVEYKPNGPECRLGAAKEVLKAA